MKRNSISDRLNDYKSVLRLWINSKDVKTIIIVENSAFPLTELEAICHEAKHDKEIRFVSFYGQDFPRELGKGYGEYLALREVTRELVDVLDGRIFLKVNGRYYLNNVHSYFKQLSHCKDMFVDLSNNLSWADSRVFGGSFEFLEKYVLEECSNIDDTKGLYFEHCLAKATLRAKINGKMLTTPRTIPDITGHSGTSNVEYKISRISYLKQIARQQIKAWMLR